MVDELRLEIQKQTEAGVSLEKAVEEVARQHCMLLVECGGDFQPLCSDLQACSEFGAEAQRGSLMFRAFRRGLARGLAELRDESPLHYQMAKDVAACARETNHAVTH